jgi:hypothetical protein
LNIQRPGKFDIDFNSLKRIFQRKDSQVLRFLIQAFENSEVLKVVRFPLSDLLSFKLVEKVCVPNHFARHERRVSAHHPATVVNSKN